MKYDRYNDIAIHKAVANEVRETNRLLRIMIYCYLQTHLQIKGSPKQLEKESLELLGDTADERYGSSVVQ